MPANVGDQTVTLLYYAPATSAQVNKRFKDIRQTGIYSGGYLSIVDSSHAQLSPLVCEINDDTHQVRIETESAVTISVAQATPYVVLRWTYTGSTSDYMEILAVATPSTNDLVVGKCTFAGGGALQGFDYGDNDYPRSTPNIQDLFLKVEPTGDNDLRVRIRSGRVQGHSGITFVPDQKSNLFTPPSSNSKVYLVYVDPDTGTVSIDSSGSESANPVPPAYKGKLVLAEVTLASTDTSITADKINDVRPFLTPGHRGVDNTTIGVNSDGKLYVKSNSIGYDSLRDVYDSGWFVCSAGGTYNLNHNLNSIAIMVQVLFAPDSGGSPDLSKVQIESWHHDIGNERGAKIVDITTTQLTVQAGGTSAAFYPNSSGRDVAYSSGHYRVIAIRIA